MIRFMNKHTRQLLAENNAFEKTLRPENAAVLTDIVVYLRSSPLTESQQEILRRDIAQMIADGEARGEDAQAVLGSDYRAFCDAIVQEVPPLSWRARLFSLLSQAFLYTAVLAGLWLAGGLVQAALEHRLTQPLPLTLGSVLSGLLVIIIASALVHYICRHAFDTPQVIKPLAAKVRTVLFIFLGTFGCFGLLLICQTYLTIPLLYLPLGWALVLLALLAAGYYVTDRYLTE